MSCWDDNVSLYVKWSKKRVATGWGLVCAVARERLVDIHGVIGYHNQNDIEFNVCSMQHILGDASVLIFVPFF